MTAGLLLENELCLLATPHPNHAHPKPPCNQKAETTINGNASIVLPVGITILSERDAVIINRIIHPTGSKTAGNTVTRIIQRPVGPTIHTVLTIFHITTKKTSTIVTAWLPNLSNGLLPEGKRKSNQKQKAERILHRAKITNSEGFARLSFVGIIFTRDE